jgi:hypothetical protein
MWTVMIQSVLIVDDVVDLTRSTDIAADFFCVKIACVVVLVCRWKLSMYFCSPRMRSLVICPRALLLGVRVDHDDDDDTTAIGTDLTFSPVSKGHSHKTATKLKKESISDF